MELGLEALPGAGVPPNYKLKPQVLVFRFFSG